MSDLHKLTLAAARDGLRAKQFTSTELTQSVIGAMSEHRMLNAFILDTHEHGLAQAKASDAKLAKGEGGIIEGIPVAVKDLFCTKGFRTTACSHILDGFVPQYESTVTEKLFAQGGVMVGKTNMDEFAMGSANMTSYYGPVINPWKPKSASTEQGEALEGSGEAAGRPSQSEKLLVLAVLPAVLRPQLAHV